MIERINKETRWLNVLGLIIQCMIVSIVISCIGWFKNWRVGHENEHELKLLNLFTNTGLVSFAIFIIAFITLIVIAVIRHNRISSLNTNANYKKINKFLVYTPFIITIMAILFLFIIELGRNI